MGEAAGDSFVVNHVGGDTTEVSVPDLRIKTYQEQVDYLLLAWSLYLCRASITNDEFHAFWGVLPSDNDTSGAAQLQKVLPPEYHLDGTMTASHILNSIQTHSLNARTPLSQKASSWENGHILLAAGVPSNDIQNVRISRHSRKPLLTPLE